MNLSSSSSLKIGFWQSIWASCLDIGVYPLFRYKSWWSISACILLLGFLLSISVSLALYRNLQRETYKLFQELPTLTVSEAGIGFPEGLSLPYVKTFQNEEQPEANLALILDDGQYLEFLRKFYKNAIFFTKSGLLIQSGSMTERISAKELSLDQSFQLIFGKPAEITPLKLSFFTSAVSVFWVMLLMPFPKLPFIFPLPFVLTLSLIFSALTAASMAQTLQRDTELTYIEILRLSAFAAIPGGVILMIGLSLLSWEWTGALFATSWFLQIAYLVSGLKACKTLEDEKT